MGDWASAVADLEALAPHMGSECTLKLHEAGGVLRTSTPPTSNLFLLLLLLLLLLLHVLV